MKYKKDCGKILLVSLSNELLSTCKFKKLSTHKAIIAILKMFQKMQLVQTYTLVPD